jgi:hypothetical protein
MLIGFAGVALLPWFTSLWWYGAGAAVVVGFVGIWVEAARRDRMRRNVETGKGVVVQHRSKLAELQAQLAV